MRKVGEQELIIIDILLQSALLTTKREATFAKSLLNSGRKHAKFCNALSGYLKR